MFKAKSKQNRQKLKTIVNTFLPKRLQNAEHSSIKNNAQRLITEENVSPDKESRVSVNSNQKQRDTDEPNARVKRVYH